MNRYIFKMKSDNTSKYIQIFNNIKRLINTDKIKDGEKLPSIRKLSNMLNVNRDTIINAYNKLEQKGYAIKKLGSGTYVKKKEITKNLKKEYFEELKKISKDEENRYIDFIGESACGEFFSVDQFKNVINEVLDRDGKEALSYQESLGYEGLRERICKLFWKDKITKDNVLIVSGAQQGIDIVSKSIININDGVIVEKPTYAGAISVFKSRRANILEVPMNKDGIDVSFLKNLLKTNNIKCLYTMSYFQNPTGISCSILKKKEILNLATIYDFYIIEDDYLSELIYDKKINYKSFKSLDKNNRVIYIKSFSKIFLPGIRIGYVIPPKLLLESIQSSKVDTDIATSTLMQRALDLYFDKGFWVEYIKNLNKQYNDKYNYVIDIIKKLLKDEVEYLLPGGGLHFYLKIKEHITIDSMDLFRMCKKEKLLISPGILFYKNQKEGLRYFKIGFSKCSKEEFLKGIIIISNILKS